MVALGRRLQQLVSLGAGEVSWLKDNSVHLRRRWTLEAPVAESTPENQPKSATGIIPSSTSIPVPGS